MLRLYALYDYVQHCEDTVIVELRYIRFVMMMMMKMMMMMMTMMIIEAVSQRT